MYKFQKDQYRRARGGSSQILDVSCAQCGVHVAYYQKDGPGMLKRMYIDRFIDATPMAKELSCPACSNVLGVYSIYKKENRPAYHLRVGSITKKVVDADELS